MPRINPDEKEKHDILEHFTNKRPLIIEIPHCRILIQNGLTDNGGSDISRVSIIPQILCNVHWDGEKISIIKPKEATNGKKTNNK